MTVTGIYRATPLRVNPRQRTVKAVYKTYIDVIHFRKTDLKKLRERDEEDDTEGWALFRVLITPGHLLHTLNAHETHVYE